MTTREQVAMVRCRLGDGLDGAAQRYVPLAEFGLWKYLLETRHRKRVLVDAISVWVPEEPSLWSSGLTSEDIDAVVRVQFTVPGVLGARVPIVRYLSALSYPQAQEALFSHYPPGTRPADLRGTAGYFLPLSRPERSRPGIVA
jgi:hypothetical protein